MGINKGLPVVISGPSGSGKTTLSRLVIDSCRNMKMSVSTTTRPPRKGEEDGVHYNFVSEDQFKKAIAEGSFLEWSEVHGFMYGTSSDLTRSSIEAGTDMLFVLDIGGGLLVKQRLDSVNIFLVPPAISDLEERLRRRGTDNEDVILRRLNTAPGEVKVGVIEYDYVVENHRLENALGDILSIIRAEKIRRANRELISNNVIG